MKGSLAAFAALMLAGCTHFVAQVVAHKAELAATALVAGTVQQVGGALVETDEVARRLEHRVEDAQK